MDGLTFVLSKWKLLPFPHSSFSHLLMGSFLWNRSRYEQVQEFRGLLRVSRHLECCFGPSFLTFRSCDKRFRLVSSVQTSGSLLPSPVSCGCISGPNPDLMRLLTSLRRLRLKTEGKGRVLS